MKICAVSYLNTKPFLYGLEHQIKDLEIILQIPSLCVEHFKNQNSDVALIPAGALLDFQEILLIDDFCIGANGKVDSVFLFSEQPIHNLKTIYLDNHSRTSNGLVKILANYYWKQALYFQNIPQNSDSFDFIKPSTGAVVIGDRAIKLKNHYAFIYDLAYEWKEWTGLPFVFAVWAIHPQNNYLNLIPVIKNAFAYGLSHIEEVATIWSNAFGVNKNEVLDYYQKNISYELDKTKKQALKLYLQYLANLEKNSIPNLNYC